MSNDPSNRDLLRVLTCGSVDDGKSTLIGRLLYDTRSVGDDLIAGASRTDNETGENSVDFADLVDGLAAEREQGITIDVAYRYFATEKRKFILADTPGHEQYTRNMATGASTANVAILLIDARKGVLSQTRRHAIIVDLMGIKKIVLAVNKMDLVNFSRSIYEEIVTDFLDFSSQLNFEKVTPIPMAAKFGENIVERSKNMPWHERGYYP